MKGTVTISLTDYIQLEDFKRRMSEEHSMCFYSDYGSNSYDYVIADNKEIKHLHEDNELLVHEIKVLETRINELTTKKKWWQIFKK